MPQRMSDGSQYPHSKGRTAGPAKKVMAEIKLSGVRGRKKFKKALTETEVNDVLKINTDYNKKYNKGKDTHPDKKRVIKDKAKRQAESDMRGEKETPRKERMKNVLTSKGSPRQRKDGNKKAAARQAGLRKNQQDYTRVGETTKSGSRSMGAKYKKGDRSLKSSMLGKPNWNDRQKNKKNKK